MARLKSETQLHFVGIGGIGMSGIAEVFLNQGYRVSGSDIADSDTSRRLEKLGARVHVGHRAENVSGADVVVVSSAIRHNNPELLEARRLRIPVIPRAEMLGELMRGKVGVAVGGTHGKTTTTSMLAVALTHAGLDPTIVIGGKVDSLGGNAKLGQGQFVVAEADESDGSFLHLPATYAVITNVDDDHLDHFGNLQAIEAAFVDFVGKLPFYGMAVVCREDVGVQRCLPRFTKPFVTYGLSEEADYYAKDVTSGGLGSSFDVFERKNRSRLGRVELKIPGRHNVLNALAAITVALQLEIPFEKIAEGLRQFHGVKRRFEIRWQNPRSRRAIVDDYGHHPTEIAATLAAARSYWPGRIVTVFQPHRYTRTQSCHEGFLRAFTGTDVLLMTDIYAASEDPIPGVTAEGLLSDIGRVSGGALECVYVRDLESARDAVLGRIRDGDLVLCLGAGSITRLPDQLAAALSQGS